MNRGEVWLADLGYAGKIRPVLILSILPGPDDRALVSYIIRTTSLRGTAYEIIHDARGMKPGAFDCQGIGTTDQSRFIRKLGRVEETILSKVAIHLSAWLGLTNH
ncbi:MAG: type II toxin-antitoxin system PemK/MazF family toxin [Akkermansiaceae bacterium]|nr:type II toxin-antitoxin system PemK/MazF family toxin [Akkermansiaceae bacterium]